VTPHVRFWILRFSGILLVVLGVLHLAVTSSISRMITIAARPTALAWLRPPMLLNHVVVGILLLPLGVLTAYAAPHAGRGDRWAVVIARATALTVAALPPTLFFLMGMSVRGGTLPRRDGDRLRGQRDASGSGVLAGGARKSGGALAPRSPRP
jgi:hypothetical protein